VPQFGDVVSVYNPAAKLFILMRTHSDYDIFDYEIVGVTDQDHVAQAFIQVGIFNDYWSNEVITVTLNTLQEHTDVHLTINEWLDPESNPLCQCGHRFMHHRRKNHSGSCKHNVAYPTEKYGKVGHKCKGFHRAERQPLPATDKGFDLETFNK
jgi:hypothetical protein